MSGIKSAPLQYLEGVQKALKAHAHPCIIKTSAPTYCEFQSDQVAFIGFRLIVALPLS